MYGWLLESVQFFVVEECGEEIWEIILQEVGAKNTVFEARQQYPDTLMLRLASALARFTKDPNSPTASRSVSPSTRKPSFKSKPTWRSSSVNTDGRTKIYKCPFTSANALIAATKKEMDAYNSAEEIDRKKEEEFWQSHSKFQRKSAAMKLDDFKPIQEYRVNCKDSEDGEDESEEDLPAVSKFQQPRRTSLKPEMSSPEKRKQVDSLVRKNSCTVAIDVYKRRGSAQYRPQINTSKLISDEKRNSMREKFETPEQAMLYFGRCFVKFFTKYKYDTMIRATGRYFCTFLQSVDSIHQRMRFTYPSMLSPTMQLTRAHRLGAELVYSSTRTGFAYYLIGQLYEIAEDIFSLKLKATIVKESMEGNYNVAVLKLEFDNNDYVQSVMMKKNLPGSLPAVPASLLLQLFPFGVMLDRKMKIMMAGEKLVEAWGGPSRRLLKSAVSDILRLRKPKVAFTWDKVVCMQNMMFELELLRCSLRRPSDTRRTSQGARAILLKGPIYFLKEIDSLVFLCSPIFNCLEELQQAGLYLADMNGHGLSKELVLQGWQHLSRLELLFEKAENRSNSLEKSRRLRDDWKKKGDQLLYSMIPKPFAAQLGAGKDAKAFWQGFDSVTIMFFGVQLSEAGSRADVMQTVAYMNDVYTRIDRLLDTHRVYKVETVGTVYLLVSGAPERRRNHADCVAGAALDVSRTIPNLTVGINSGPCVAGVLSLRVPRYCVVGDTVNTASRMQTTCEPGRIQISAATAEQLSAGRFRLRKRGPIKIKGKGMMETYWLEGEIEEDDQEDALQYFSALCG